MNKHIIGNLRRGYDAFSRGDIQGAVEALDPDPDILWSEPEDFSAGGTYRGPQGVAEYLTLSYESFLLFVLIRGEAVAARSSTGFPLCSTGDRDPQTLLARSAYAL